MARVRYVQDEDANEEVAELFASTRRLVGRVSNFHRVLGHVPFFHRWYVPMQGSIRNLGHLTKRDHAIAHIRASVVNGAGYCTEHSIEIGAKVGLPEDEIGRLLERQFDAGGCFNSRDLALIGWVDAVASNTARTDESSFVAIQEHLSDPELVELTVLVGLRTMTNLVQEALQVDLEDKGSPDSRRSPEPFSDAVLAHVDLLEDQMGRIYGKD